MALDFRYVRLDGRGRVHVSTTSIQGPAYGETLCGQSGALQPVVEDAKVTCRECGKGEKELQAV